MGEEIKIDFESFDFHSFAKEIAEGSYNCQDETGFVGIPIPIPLLTTQAPIKPPEMKSRLTRYAIDQNGIVQQFERYFNNEVDWSDLCKLMEIMLELGYAVKKDGKIWWRHNP